MLSLIVLFPFLGFLINGVWYAAFQTGENRKKAGVRSTGTIASVSIGLSFLVSLILFIQLMGMPEANRVLEQTLFSWMKIGSFNLDVAFRLDALSALFALVITGVGTLIHIYSIGYMSHDEAPGKYFAYLNLFCFAMLILVLGSSLPMLFLGWEGVGLCSYLLIGFWYTDPEKASAGKKAFVVNRIGDLGFLIGMFLVFSTFGTLDFSELRYVVQQNEHLGNLQGSAITLITMMCLFLFVGCCGKSAQIPLYVWLPDAMAGPTPVSALIHAATMVTSGIYLISRLNFLYVLSPTALAVIAWVGALTALFAASMAIAQRDIKKVLAYSTVSQLGYMFLACGVGAFSAGVFHVITHAFFKALLFMGAGSVIFGMHHQQDIMKMGGLKSKMPQTFLIFTIGWFAICGVPGFSGFFSKDEILWRSMASPTNGSFWLWAIGFVTALMTAFYMSRLFALTFQGKFRSKEDSAHPVHESPKVMVYPLFILAGLSAVGGFMGIPHMSWLAGWLYPISPDSHESIVPGYWEWILMALSGLSAMGIMFFTTRLYRNLESLEKWKKKWASVYRVLENKWYVDELFEFLFVRPIFKLSQFLWKRFDVGVVDWVVLGFGRASQWAGQTARVVQTGSVQVYATILFIGLLVAMGYLFYGLA